MGRALIVSAGASSNEYLCARLTELGYTRPLIVPSGAEARRRMLESDFELIVVNAPLPDEFGHDLCATAVEKTDAGVVFLVKAAAEQAGGIAAVHGVGRNIPGDDRIGGDDGAVADGDARQKSRSLGRSTHRCRRRYPLCGVAGTDGPAPARSTRRQRRRRGRWGRC